MKKKAIEKVPFLGLPKVNRGKMVEYVGVTAVVEIAGEAHLFLEVYRNKRSEKGEPVVRIVLTEKDFGTWFVGRGEWSRGKILGTTWDSHNLIWREDDERIKKSDDFMARENILNSEEDLGRIKEFCNIRNGLRSRRSYIAQWKEGHWWEYIDERQQYICGEEQARRRSRICARRQQALKERADNTPELPEDRILEYADRFIFHRKHYLYYKKRGAWVDLACSSCGRTSYRRWKPGISYESSFCRMVEEPGTGRRGTCPLCGKMGEYLPQGRAKSVYSLRNQVFLGQRYKEKGMLFRYIEVKKQFQLELRVGEKTLEMAGAGEKLESVEIARAYFEPGKELQTDYHKCSCITGADYWDDCNMSGFGNIVVRPAVIMPDTFREMEGTLLQYSALEEYEQEETEKINPVDYAERYMQFPQIEMLSKMGLICVVRSMVKGFCGIVMNSRADRPDSFLGIRKERVKLLIRRNGDLNLLRVMQIEKKHGQRWTDEQIEKLAEICLDSWNIALERMSAQKFLNAVEKYAGCEFGTGCSRAIDRLKATAQEYTDYLSMRQQMGYDMTNTVYLFPRNLTEAHNRMVAETNWQKEEERIREVLAKYPLIKKNYRRLRGRFYYEDEKYLIRPARDAAEIVMEGRILHHCVGGDRYLERHNGEKTIILFLRSVQEPDVPYITVEIEPEGLGIRQWYGAHDKKPDKENMDRWLNAYVTRLKCGQIGEAEGEKTEERILLRA